jgi:hypothetical protein
LHRRAPLFYWAQCLDRSDLRQIVNEEVQRDKYPGVNRAARLAFALGGAFGSGALARIEDNSHLMGAKGIARRALRDLDKKRTVWDVIQLSKVERVTINGTLHIFSKQELRADAQRLEQGLDTLLCGLPQTTNLCQTFDALCYGSRLRT